MAKKKLFFANWKMSLLPNQAVELAGAMVDKIKPQADQAICLLPSFSALSLVQTVAGKSQLQLGAQDVFWEEKGAYTGEISTTMLKDSKCGYVIVGHSERRRYLGETDEIVNKKMLAAVKSGFNVILCVGEHHRENHNEIPPAVEDQVKAALANVPKSAMDKITVAYEPVWAIGTGIPDTPEGAMMAAVLIRKTAIGILGPSAKKMRVVYGGSVNSENAGNFINHEGIDGVLVGGASLDPQEFAKIILSAK